MRSRKFGLFLFGAALLFAFIASVVAVRFVDLYRKSETVMVVNKDLSAFTQITDKDLDKKDVPLAAVDANTIVDAKQAIGKYTRTIVPSGSILNKRDLSTIDNANGGVSLPLSELKEGDLRAVGIPEEFVHELGSNVKDQDHVDLVGVFNHDKVIFSRTLAYAVPVLHKNPVDQGGGMVVAVTAQQAQDIALAMKYGKLVVSVTPYRYKTTPLPDTKLETLLGGEATNK